MKLHYLLSGVAAAALVAYRSLSPACFRWA